MFRATDTSAALFFLRPQSLPDCLLKNILAYREIFVILQTEMNKDDAILDMIRTTVRATEPDAEIILYGSRARGDARKDSDWDIIVILNKPPMLHQERYSIANELWNKGFDMGEEINTLVYTIDQWRNAPPSLLKYNVREEGVKL